MRLKARNLPIAACWPAAMTPMPASPAPAAIAAAPRTSDRIMIPVATLTPSCDADDVAAGDVADLVGDDALHLVGVVGGGDQARMDVDDLAAGDEGVDRPVVDQDDLDVVGPEARPPRRSAATCRGTGPRSRRRAGSTAPPPAGPRSRSSRPDEESEASDEGAPPLSVGRSFSHGASYPVAGLNLT